MKISEEVTKTVTNYFLDKVKHASLTEEQHEKINDTIQDTVEMMLDRLFDCDMQIDNIIDDYGERDVAQEQRDCEDFVTKYQLGGAF